MLKNPYYQYGSRDINIPARINFGEFMVGRLWLGQDKDAFIHGVTGETISYRTICQQTMNFAISLTLLGVRRGHTVAICTQNRPEYWSALIGITCTGATASPCNPGYTEGELKHVLKISKPKFIVVSPTVYKQHTKFFKSQNNLTVILLGEERTNNVIMYNDLAVSSNGSGSIVANNRLARNVTFEEFEVADVKGETDTLFILYSSGTSGLPKGVMLTHLNLLSQCTPPAQEVIVSTMVSITPWFHSMGLIGGLNYLVKGRTTVHLPKFEVDLFLRTIEKYKLQAVSLVPPIIVAISKVQKEYDLSSVQMVFSGAAPLHKDTEDLVKAKFPNAIGVFQGYGLTEATMALTLSITDEHQIPVDKPGSVGKPVKGMVIKVVDVESRKPLGPKQTGEICAKGLSIMKGYVGKDKSVDFDEEGFFNTGDLGYYDEEGSFFIVDRLKELIKYKGYQVAPAELEALLLQHPSVRDAGVVGVADHVAGEVPKAFIVVQPGSEVTEEEIKVFVAERLSSPKHLRGGVRFIDAIPKNPSGKILRKDLRLLAKKERSKL